MPTSKKQADSGANDVPETIKFYERAVEELGEAIGKFQAGDYAGARERLETLLGSLREEPLLADRCRTYIAICKLKTAAAPPRPETADECYQLAVMKSNDGEADEAIRLLDHALQSEPTSPRLLYARASAWAIKGNAEAAVGDLRQAIAAEPQVRFQAVNDPDFEPIREEPAFIDLIEPTPTGA